MILKFFAIFIFVKYMSSFYKILLLITLSVFSTLNLSAEDDFRQNTTTKNLTQQQLNILNNTLVKNGVKNTQFEELLTKICTDENAALLNKITQPTWSTKLTKLSNDLANAPPAFKNKIIQTPQLVEAWEVLDDALVDDLIRKNIDEVEFVDDFINNNPNKTKTQITADINTQGYNAWKLAQGVDDYFNGLVNASDYILNGTYIQGVKKIDLFGGSVSQIGGDFVNIDLLATKGIKGDVSDLSKFIPSNSIDEMIVSNPFPNAPFSGPRDFFLSETSKVMKPGSKITINGTISNKFFKKIKAGNIEDLGFEILEYQIPLKAEFQNIIFYQVDGITQIPSGNMLTTVIRKL